MGLSKKLADAKSSDWLCQGIADEEVVKIISEAKEKAREQIKLIDTLDKIRAELIQSIQNGTLKIESGNEELFRIINKYKYRTEIEVNEEVVQCKDCISRQAVLDKKELVELEDGQSFYCINPKDVETLPSVTPQPKSGEWKYVTHYARRYRVCSECNAEKEDDRATGWNFCPHCGADMIGGDTDETN